MIRRFAFAALMLIMAPAFALAGSYSIAVSSGSSTGSVGPAPLSGYATATKNFTATAAATYTLSKVTKNGVDVTANTTYVNGTTITIPLSTSSQTFYVSFAKTVQVTPTLSAGLPAAITIPAGTPTTLSGASSTISNLNSGTQATFTFGGAGLTFSPISGNVTDPTFITTNVTAAAAGTYTGTLTLTAPNGAGTVTSNTANVTITVLAAGVAGSNACLNCHNGWQQATDYASSIHANSNHSTCDACHQASTTGHPGNVNSNTVNQTSFVVTASSVTAGGSAATITQGNLVCTACHTAPYPIPHFTTPGISCVACHTNSGTGDAHQIQPSSVVVDNTCATCHQGDGSTLASLQKSNDDCLGCHNVVINHAGAFISDNNGVRAIVPEFGKNSHHVVGVTLGNKHCATCHMEGKLVNGNIVIDHANHMADQKVHLRNCNTALSGNQSKATDDGVTFGGGAQYVWDPANPDHAAMDQFCMSCHNSAGAPDAYTISGSADAHNPFNDTVATAANGYDKQGRPSGVVPVFDQFDPSNVSHHAVRGQRYTTRSSATALANGSANALTAAGQSSPTAKGFYASTQKTLYDGGLMGAGTAAYTPLGATQVVADDSTIHCGDCHTVGQWKNDNTQFNQAAIGAHGSVNEYMLRNSVGTDQIHGLSSFVCFNCHNDKAAGDVRGGYYASAFWNMTSQWRAANSGVANGVGFFRVHINSLHPSAVGSTSSFRWPSTIDPTTGKAQFVDANKPYESSGCIGGTAGIAFRSYTGSIHYVNTATTNEIGRTNVTNGNIMGIGCLNCHNSGRTGFGGIHGSNATYTTGWSFASVTPTSNATYAAPTTNAGYASTQSVYRFMPGNANYGYVPPNSTYVSSATTSLRNVGAPGKAAWEWNGGSTVTGGCYTNNYVNGMTNNQAINGGDSPAWSGCNHHSADRNDIGGANRNSAVGNIGRTLYY